MATGTSLPVREALNASDQVGLEAGGREIGRSSRPARIVEVLGPAGAGKTTLIRALRDSIAGLSDGVPLSAASRIRTLSSVLATLLPPYLREYRDTRWFTREELRRLVYVQGWHHRLARQPAARRPLVVFDHGPIFMLGMLHAFGPEFVKSPLFKAWSNARVAQWATTLDVVLWLDAPDSMLVERIEAREWHHAVKGKSIREARAFLRRSRLAFERILAELPPVQPRVLRVDTGRVSIDSIVRQLAPLVEAHDRASASQASMRPDGVT